jgi:hypothetical protein
VIRTQRGILITLSCRVLRCCITKRKPLGQLLELYWNDSSCAMVAETLKCLEQQVGHVIKGRKHLQHARLLDRIAGHEPVSLIIRYLSMFLMSSVGRRHPASS